VARVYCDCYDTETGELLDADPRQNLKRVVSEFERELGYSFLIGIEPEMMWMRRGEDGAAPEGATKPYCYHIHQFEELRPVLLDVVEYGQALGLDMSYGDHEDAPGQLELNFRFDRPVRTADNITTYRQVCAAVGRKHGLLPSFMPKPFTGVSANGHHHHFTLVDDEGNNVFHDPSGPAQLSDTARHFLGGMLDHFGALMCVGNPTVNSYCRMWDFGFWAPVYKNWGWQNRTCTVRVASGGRFEYRGVDSSCNPYLTVAALLVAGLDGIKRELDPGEPQSANTYDLLQEANGKQPLERVPDSLGDALIALGKDDVIRDGAMPGRLWKVFHHYKRDEWERYLAAVTDWERDEYLEVLP
jgi:glutamine synthetase